MSATVCPGSSVVGELPVDIGFATGTRGHRGGHVEHGREAGRGAHRSNEHLDLAVELIHSFVELDVPAVQLSSNHNAAFHAPNRGDATGETSTTSTKTPNL